MTPTPPPAAGPLRDVRTNLVAAALPLLVLGIFQLLCPHWLSFKIELFVVLTLILLLQFALYSLDHWGNQRGLAISAIVGSSGLALGSAIIWILCPAHSITVVISAKSYPFTNTGLIVAQGDEITISYPEPSPNWNCGGNDLRIAPAGLPNDERSATALFPSANFCSLIGSIGGARPFLTVGQQENVIAPIAGELTLAANDAPPDSCFLDPPIQCYADNTGSIAVTISVK